MKLWGQGTQSELPQLHPGAKPLVGLFYFNTFETCNSRCFLLQFSFLLLYFRVNFKWVSTNDEHVVERGILQTRWRFSSLHLLCIMTDSRRYVLERITKWAFYLANWVTTILDLTQVLVYSCIQKHFSPKAAIKDMYSSELSFSSDCYVNF